MLRHYERNGAVAAFSLGTDAHSWYSDDRIAKLAVDLDPREPVDQSFVLRPTPLTRSFVLDSTRS